MVESPNAAGKQRTPTRKAPTSGRPSATPAESTSESGFRLELVSGSADWSSDRRRPGSKEPAHVPTTHFGPEPRFCLTMICSRGSVLDGNRIVARVTEF